MSRLIIADGFCPRPYSDKSLRSEALGGTESAIVLLAEALADQHDVTVLQHCRTHDCISPRGVRYCGAPDWRTAASRAAPSEIIVINSPKMLGIWARAHRHRSLYLWRHNFLGNRHRSIADTLECHDATLVCVSRFQRDHAQRHTRPGSHGRPETATPIAPRSVVIPNPVEAYANAAAHPDRDRLIFCSSPHKGLDQVIGYFRHARRVIPSLTLAIANPGYMADRISHERGVSLVGALPRPKLHAVIARSLCVFYPQNTFPETFCLVAAESNAVGTPVLAPMMGALPDVAYPPDQLIPELSEDAVVDCLQRWRADERPLTRLRPEYSVQSVARRWHQLLAAGGATTSSHVGFLRRPKLPLSELSATA